MAPFLRPLHEAWDFNISVQYMCRSRAGILFPPIMLSIPSHWQLTVLVGVPSQFPHIDTYG